MVTFRADRNRNLYPLSPKPCGLSSFLPCGYIKHPMKASSYTFSTLHGEVYKPKSQSPSQVPENPRPACPYPDSRAAASALESSFYNNESKVWVIVYYTCKGMIRFKLLSLQASLVICRHLLWIPVTNVRTSIY